MVSRAGLTGFYLRVLEPGEIRAGDRIELERRDPAGLTIRAAYAALTGEGADPELLRRGLAADGLTEGLRRRILKAIGDPPGS
jgi:MOSC domain-containing protein YiiM